MAYFKVYRSSAGSGKTFTLTKEYLKLALVAPAYLQDEPLNPYYFKPDYFRHILAITFTNDAAREMKHRILKDLGEIADVEKAKKNKVFEMMLAEIPNEFPDWNLAHQHQKLYEELQKRATELYRHILHSYSDFSVSTIDSFTNRLARSFNKDLDLPYNYEIELSTEDIITQAVYQLIEDADEKKNPELANLLVNFAEQRIENETSWQIDKLLGEFAKNIFEEDKGELLKPLYELNPSDFKEIKAKLYAYKNKIEGIITKAANDAEALMHRFQFEKKDFYYGDYFNYIQEHKTFDKSSFLKEYKRLSESIANHKWLSKEGEKDVVKKNSMEHLSLQFGGIYNEIEKLKQKEITDYIAVCDTLPRFYQLATLSEIGKRIQVILSENTQATLASLNEKIREIVEQSPVPYIYERLGEKYFHILIDEFQDTSKIQWGNLLPLLAHSLDMQRTSMVVGDAKQAIYRWRGGEAEILAELPNLATISHDSPHKDAEITFAQYFEHNNLASNRRSLKEIVEFNNAIFEFVMMQYPEYETFIKHYYGQTQSPEYQRKDYEKGHIEIATFNGEEKDEYYKTTSKYIIEKVKNLTQNGYNYGDIVLLVRRNSDAAWLSAQLVNNGIPITSDESLKLCNSAKVNFIVNFLSLLAQPLNPDVKAEIIYFLKDYVKNNPTPYPLPYWEGKNDLEEVKNSPPNRGGAGGGVKNSPPNRGGAGGGVKNSPPNRGGAGGGVKNSPPNRGGAGGGVLDTEIDDIKAITNDPDLENLSIYIREKFGYQIRFENLQYLSLYEIGEELIRTFGFQHIATDRVYLNALLDKLVSFGIKNGNNTLDFREYWKQKGERLTVSMSGEGGASKAVRIMTIHKSKGLEFPVVILPFADWGLKSKTKELWIKWNNKIAPQLPLCVLSYAELLTKTGFTDEYNHENQAAFIENINVLYVALTRAKEQLYVCCKTVEKINAIDSVNKMLIKYLEQNPPELITKATREISPNENKITENENETTENENSDNTIFVIHDDQSIRKLQFSKEPEILNSLISSECRDKLRVRQQFSAKNGQTDGQINGESSNEKYKSLLLTDLFDAQNKGNIIHKAFERLVFRTDIEKAVNKLISEGLITNIEGKEISIAMHEILALPEIAHLYEYKQQRRIFNERDLLVKPKYYDDINKVIRPDRVVIDDETQTVYIIDYKTGMPKDSHHAQISNYAQQFSDMGYKDIKKILVYTEARQVKFVS